MTLPALRDDRELAPLREYLAELGPRALPAIVEALLALPEVPAWVRVLGPWTRLEGSGAVWARQRPSTIPPGVVNEYTVWRDAGAWWRTAHAIAPERGPHPTRAAAMASIDAEQGVRWLLLGELPPEEEPAPAPVPAEEGEGVRAQAPRGPGERAGQHMWRIVDGTSADRCEQCGLWRQGRMYYPSTAPPGEALVALHERRGGTIAGRCVPREST